MLEEIEAEGTVRFADADAVSPCVRANSMGEARAWDGDQLAVVDAFFTESDEIPATGHPYYAKFVRVGVAAEAAPLSRTEWVEFAALFYNNESLASYVVERARLSYDIQRQSTEWDLRDLVWVDSFTSEPRTATMVSDAYFSHVASDAQLQVVNFGEMLSEQELKEVLANATAVIINHGGSLNTQTASEMLGAAFAEQFGLHGGAATLFQPSKDASRAVRVFQMNKYGAGIDGHVFAAPDLLLSDLIKATRDVAPWNSAEYMYLRPVHEPVVDLSADFSACGMGVSRPTDPNNLRQRVAIELVTVIRSNPTDTVVYAPMTDYFPYKFYPRSTSDFSVSYHLTWKMVRNRRSNEMYILVQRGAETAAPDDNVGDKRFYIPAQTTALQNPPEAGIAALLGVLDAAEFVVDAPVPCVLKGLAEAQYSAFSSSTTCSDLRAIDVVFGHVRCDNTAHSRVSASPEPLGRTDWVGYMSLFHNRESRALEVTKTVSEKYLCIREQSQKAARAAGKRPRLLRIRGKSYEPGVFEAMALQHDQRIWNDAGGSNAAFDERSAVLQNSGGSVDQVDSDGQTLTIRILRGVEMLNSALVDVDVLLDANDWFGAIPDVHEALGLYNLTVNDTRFSFISKRQVYRLDQRVSSETWTTDESARYVFEAAAVLQDWASVLFRQSINATGTYFLRNVFEGKPWVEVRENDCVHPSAEAQLLTHDSSICDLPCDARTTDEYCAASCYRWADGSCRSSPVYHYFQQVVRKEECEESSSPVQKVTVAAVAPPNTSYIDGKRHSVRFYSLQDSLRMSKRTKRLKENKSATRRIKANRYRYSFACN
ncbi:hypothetical protein DIPPA_21352 [Diplonema papillatum]|nr:hypothetical protein DIPPA_21352 [Diplonema papillatum]